MVPGRMSGLKPMTTGKLVILMKSRGQSETASIRWRSASDGTSGNPAVGPSQGFRPVALTIRSGVDPRWALSTAGFEALFLRHPRRGASSRSLSTFLKGQPRRQGLNRRVAMASRSLRRRSIFALDSSRGERPFRTLMAGEMGSANDGQSRLNILTPLRL